MPTILIEDVPEEVVGTFGGKVSYKSVSLAFRTNRLVGLSKEAIEDQFFDAQNETYGPFLNAEEAITFLDRK